MAGSQTLRLRGSGSVATLTLALLAFAGLARGQYSSPPARSFADLAESDNSSLVMPAPTTVPVSAYGEVPAGTRVLTGLFDTITESLCGKPDPNAWRPLTFSTLFSEGWNEAWVPSPNGSGGAPRQGWINAADGNLYRLSFFTFSQGFNGGPKGDAYLGAYTIFAPLNRRLDLIINVPFVLRNNAVTGLPIIDPNRPQATTTQSRTGFGDLSFTPRVLLHETKDFPGARQMVREVRSLTQDGRSVLVAPLAPDA